MAENTSKSVRDSLGTARVVDERRTPRAETVTDGPELNETLRNLESRGMSRRALEDVRLQAAGLLEEVVDAYTSDVGAGEVGRNGSGRTSFGAPTGNEPPTGLLYGRVQSGKTVAMIVASAMAIDNGFRVIVVLTSNNLKLVKQTADRFHDLDGPVIYSSLDSAGGVYAWDRNRTNIETWVRTRGVVFVCAKEDGHLRALIRFLQTIDAAQYPALILDDEADHATPDTRQAERSRGRPVAASSTTFRLVVFNDDPAERGFSLRETLSHNVFLQVTATPYGLLLQNLDNPLRPAFTYLLSAGVGYTGGEKFFSNARDNVESQGPPLVYVPEDEGLKYYENPTVPPQGLIRSIAFFILAAAAHKTIQGAAPRNGYKHLCHTSVNQAAHTRLSELVRDYVDGLARGLGEARAETLNREEVVWALGELRRTLGDRLPPTEALADEIFRQLPRREIIVVNAEEGGELDFRARYNFLIGGNILGRGLTIEDLLVTYYLRTARVTQMDTMHQHARMYGYREALMPYTRVFLTPSLAVRFRAIHESETALREMLGSDSETTSIQVEVVGGLRPTRPGILDVGTISAYRAGQQVYPVEPIHDPVRLEGSTNKIRRMLDSELGDGFQLNEFHRIDIETAKALIREVKVQRDDGEWDTDVILRVLDATARRYNNQCDLYVRKFRGRREPILSSGALSGEEQTRARARGVPVLCLIIGEAGKPWAAPIYYPTVVFPSDMPAMIFNRAG